MPDTGLTAALARIRDRAESLDVPFGRRPQSIAMSQADVPRLLAALDAVLELAAEFDIEDGHVPEPALRWPVSRGDRLREEISRALLGEDGT